MYPLCTKSDHGFFLCSSASCFWKPGTDWPLLCRSLLGNLKAACRVFSSVHISTVKYGVCVPNVVTVLKWSTSCCSWSSQSLMHCSPLNCFGPEKNSFCSNTYKQYRSSIENDDKTWAEIQYLLTHLVFHCFLCFYFCPFFYYQFLYFYFYVLKDTFYVSK